MKFFILHFSVFIWTFFEDDDKIIIISVHLLCFLQIKPYWLWHGSSCHFPVLVTIAHDTPPLLGDFSSQLV